MSQFEINREVVKNTKDHAAAYKLNMAFYEAEGPDGIRDLKETVHHIKSEHPEILVILDAKKGDIGTNRSESPFHSKQKVYFLPAYSTYAMATVR